MMVTASDQIDMPVVELPTVIAIHGVGRHKPDEIKESLRDAFRRASISADIKEFNWDSFIDRSAIRLRDAAQLLSTTASSISQAAALAYLPAGQGVNRVLFTLEQDLYHGVLRFLLAFGLVILIIGPLLHFLVLLPSSMFKGYADVLSSWQLGWVKIAAILAILSGLFAILGLLTLGGIRSVVTFNVRPLWVSIRRVVLLLLQPMFLLVTVPLSIRFGSGLVTLIRALLPLTLWFSVLSIAFSPWFSKFSDIFSGIKLSFLILSGSALVAGLHIVLRRFWVGALLKVILDITRYMGSPEYRTKLQEEFDREISQIRSRKETGFVLYAHSLGSVIALDSVVNSGVWRQDDEVQLVTLGSPIARFFIRFFPGYLFPPSIGDAAKAAARRLRRFSWINIHRRWDYVGTSLGLKTASVGLEICTGQWTKIASAHLNYWEDDLVVGIYKNSLTQVVPVGKKTVACEGDYTLPAVHTDTSQDCLARLIKRGAFWSVMLVIGIAVFNFIESRDVWEKSIDQEIVEIQQQGVRTGAAVTYHRTVRVGKAGGETQPAYTQYVHHFLFRLPAPYGDLPPIEIVENEVLSTNTQRFNYKALADFVIEDCTRAEEKKWWQIFRSQESIPCTRKEIPIWLKADDPASFWLPGFPAVKRSGYTLSDWIVLLILPGFFVAVCYVIVMSGGVSLFRLFLGLDVSK